MNDAAVAKRNLFVSAGILIILAKVGVKLVPILLKMLTVLLKVVKGFFGFKAVGAIASLGLYSLLFTWQMAFALVAFIVIHEYGHLAAMKRCGLKTKGIYLIPGFGAAAVSAEAFKNSRDEAFIAIWGPLFSTFFIVAAVMLYPLFPSTLFAGIIHLVTLINIFNLLPINPLDGGRITKSLLYSASPRLGLYISVGSICLAFFFGAFTKMSVLVYIAAIGLMELGFEYQDAFNNLMRTLLRIFGGIIVVFFTAKLISSIVTTPKQLNGFDYLGVLGLFVLILLVLGAFLFDAHVRTHEYAEEQAIAHQDNRYYYRFFRIKFPFWYRLPLLYLQDAWCAMMEIVFIKDEALKKRADAYARMNKQQFVFYGFSYFALLLFLFGMIYYTTEVTGIPFAKEILE